MKVNLAWKLVAGAPEDGVNYYSANKHFNVKTGKTFLKKLGGISILDFFPYTFEPTNVFYHAIESCKLENGFVGKKMPFECNAVVFGGEKKPVKIKIHRYTSELVILSVSVNQIEFNGSINDLQEMMRIESYSEIFNLVRVICSIITSGGNSIIPIQRKLKVYPYFEFENGVESGVISDKVAVELLTRHKNPKADIVESVISKNNDHQLDNNSILIDRQGILARYSSEIGELQVIQRKFESSHYLFELAIALSYIFDGGGYLTLSSEQRDSISKLINNPSVVFIKSVTAYKTWQLLLEEFKLYKLYNFITMDVESKKTPETSSISQNKSWSDLKKWIMRVFGTLLVGIVIWTVNSVVEKYKPFSNESISLLSPLDESYFDEKNGKIIFDWEDIESTKKYIFLIERHDSRSDKWLPHVNGGRYKVHLSSKSIVINKGGRFKWKVVARNDKDEDIAVSIWYYFNVKKIISNKKMLPTKKTSH